MARIAAALMGLALALAGCSDEDAEARAREIAEKLAAAMVDVEARALEQPTTPERVRAAQQALARLNEYQGEINGELDSVSVNAIQAFQRARGLEADGILNEATERGLREVLAGQPAAAEKG